MTTYEVIPAKPFHCGQILRRLRHEHVAALHRVGRNVHRELRDVFDQSFLKSAWLIDGELAAIGGVTGSLGDMFGYAWLAITEEATLHPVAMVREVKRQLNRAMVTKRELATTIIGGDAAAKRLAIFLGFHIEDEGPGAPAYTRFGRRNLSNHLESLPDIRIPIGSGYVIGMGFHAEHEWS